MEYANPVPDASFRFPDPKTSERKPRFVQRILEIIPGTLTWATIIGMFVLSWLTPVVASVFVIVFDIYWIHLTVYVAFFSALSYGEIRRGRKTNWWERVVRIRDFERYRNLQQEGAVALSSYESKHMKLADAEADLVAARRRLHDTAIKAPIAGTVTSRLVESGDLVQPGMKVANMVDLSRVRIRTSVPEKQVPLLSEGMPVQVTSDVFPGRVFRAVITTISAKSSKDHTYQVEAVMDNPKDAPFRAGMFARTAFVGGTTRQSLLIPRQALIGSLGTPEVYVVTKGQARKVRLVVGTESGNRLEILQGLSQGDLVVISGQNELGDGSAVTVVRQEGGR